MSAAFNASILIIDDLVEASSTRICALVVRFLSSFVAFELTWAALLRTEVVGAGFLAV